MLSYKRILFTGSNGRFGKVFKKTHASKEYNYPTSKELNITDIKSVEHYFKKNKVDLIIHCAALSRPMDIHNKNISKSITINIIGTCNLVKICEKYKIKLIYFSTSYVYPGSKGNYSEKSNLKPINNYAWSKLGGESAMNMYRNSLILRVSMTEKPFVHKKAFKNVITNFMYHDDVIKILPKILNLKGILNLGGEIKSVYDFVKKDNKEIKGSIAKKNEIPFNSKMSIRKLKNLMKINKI